MRTQPGGSGVLVARLSPGLWSELRGDAPSRVRVVSQRARAAEPQGRDRRLARLETAEQKAAFGPPFYLAVVFRTKTFVTPTVQAPVWCAHAVGCSGVTLW